MIRKAGDIAYTLTYKNVKNVNLHVSSDGSVQVSANKRASLAFIDGFVSSKSDWIKKAQEKVKIKKDIPVFVDRKTSRECLKFFNEISDKIYPLFADKLKSKPLIKVRLMKSRWGVCHTTKNYITLNKMLMEKPYEAAEYVVLHEYAHFLHPDHQKGFHDTMKALMPDYKERRKLLKS